MRRGRRRRIRGWRGCRCRRHARDRRRRWRWRRERVYERGNFGGDRDLLFILLLLLLLLLILLRLLLLLLLLLGTIEIPDNYRGVKRRRQHRDPEARNSAGRRW